MRILGIDPGLNAMGFGIIDAHAGHLQLVTAGEIRPPPRQPLGQRLLHLHNALSTLIATHQPVIAVLEALFTHQQYLSTAAMMGHARGVACLVCAQHQLSVVDYPPARIKKALSGYGTASKDQVARVVGAWLGVRDPHWSSDASDALAVAITHAHMSAAPAAAIAPARRSRRTRVRVG